MTDRHADSKTYMVMVCLCLTDSNSCHLLQVLSIANQERRPKTKKKGLRWGKDKTTKESTSYRRSPDLFAVCADPLVISAIGLEMWSEKRNARHSSMAWHIITEVLASFSCWTPGAFETGLDQSSCDL